MITIGVHSINWFHSDSEGVSALLSYFWMKYNEITHVIGAPNLSAGTSINYTKIVLHHLCHRSHLVFGHQKCCLIFFPRNWQVCRGSIIENNLSLTHLMTHSAFYQIHKHAKLDVSQPKNEDAPIFTQNAVYFMWPIYQVLERHSSSFAVPNRVN